jgi:hypothetical protein
MRTEGQYNHATVLKIHVIDCFFLRNSSYTVCICAPGVSDKDQVRLDVGEDGQTLTISAEFEINCVGSKIVDHLPSTLNLEVSLPGK